MFRVIVFLIFTLLLPFNKVFAGGPLIDVSSITGAKKLSKEASEAFRLEMESLLDYFFEFKLEPFAKSLNENVLQGAEVVNEMAEKRIEQINTMLEEVVAQANRDFFNNADQLQQRTLNNLESKFSKIQGEIFSELNALSKTVLRDAGCLANNAKEGFVLSDAIEANDIYKKHQTVFKKDLYGFGGTYNDPHGCFEKFNYKTDDDLSDYQKMKVYVCTIENEFDLASLKASNLVEQYGELLKVVSISYCGYQGITGSAVTQSLILETQFELISKASAWKELAN